MSWLAVISAFLLTQSPTPGRPDTVNPPASSVEDRQAYLSRRDKVADTADARMKLALWCEGRGLKAEADEQLRAVVRLDPKRDSAWKRLGYKRHNNRWMTDDQIAEAAEQLKADRHWLPILRKLHDGLHDKREPRRSEAKAAFLRLDDPRVVPALWAALAAGGASEQALAVRVLGGIRGEASAQALAVLAISGKSEEVRRAATETLRDCDPRDYAGLLIGLIRKAMRYEVKPVDGPGSPGVLLVEGAKFNVRRVYAPPAAPANPLQSGDVVTLDENGLPQINRPTSGLISMVTFDEQGNAVDTAGMQKIKVGQNAVEAQRAAALAESQLENDVAEIEKVNRSIRNTNDRAVAVLTAATGKTLGDDATAWKSWLADLEGKGKGTPTLTGVKLSSTSSSKSKPRKTFDSFVTLAYQPSYSVAQPIVVVPLGKAGISHSGST